MSFDYASVRLSSDSIRLLTLYPSRNADASRPTCNLEAFALDNAPPFTALSYAWGDASQRSLMEVNGKDLSITSTLDSTLRHLRLPDRARKLWIDQICINQADDVEKASQVSFMRHIYSQAESTVAWLGEERDGSERAIRFIQEAGREAFRIGLRDVSGADYASLHWHVTAAFSDLNNHDVEIPEGDPLGQKKVDPLGQKKVDPLGQKKVDPLGQKKVDLCKLINSKYSKQWDETLEQLHLLFSRPYFRRGWIIQEVVIPKTLIFQCGLQTVGGDEFMSFIHLDSFIQEAKRRRWTAIITALQQKYKEPITTGNLVNHCALARAKLLKATLVRAQVTNSAQFKQRFGLGQTVTIRNSFHMGGHLQEEMTLAFMIKTFLSDFEFTDPRDRVFGLLGMASDTDALDIQVDYTLSWEDVYADTVKRIIRAGNVNILSDISSPPSSTNLLPSWVPDLRTARKGLIRQYTLLSSAPFRAGGSSPSPIPHNPISSSSPTTLLLRGVQVDTILATGPTWSDSPSGSYLGNNLQPLKDVLTKLYDFSQISQKESDPVLKIAHRRDGTAPVRTAILDHESVPAASPSGPRRRATPARMCAAITDLVHGGARIPGKELWDFLIQAQILQSYAPFLGRRGFIGLGPAEMEGGDVVVVFYGCRVPFVLRPDGQRQGEWRVLGEAYCDGVMDGEALGMGLEEEIFRLL
ncbi:HET-domain-containing protein [Coniochaeta ligniaria NRRL 30616]|uniref:HET-domain-containing protein n=1 Tax=Coniochaeta ligniaria NRRL 30616 TaxID=1408157 RepID=A0A1J7I9V6_9PEZI|nr:HET-domain-containing protein [Coniochaeta ligniaria NRRL 30616]